MLFRFHSAALPSFQSGPVTDGPALSPRRQSARLRRQKPERRPGDPRVRMVCAWPPEQVSWPDVPLV